MSRAKACFHGTTLICAQQCRTHLSDPVSGIGRSACRRLLGSGCFPHRTRTCSECPLSEERRMENSFPHRIFCIAYLLCHFCGQLSTEIAESCALRGAQAVRPVRTAVFFLHRLSGALEPRRRFTLTGGTFSAPADRGTRTAQACSPFPGGEFFAEPQRGDSPSADGGSVAAPAAGAKRKDNLRFSFLFELLPFPC